MRNSTKFKAADLISLFLCWVRIRIELRDFENSGNIEEIDLLAEISNPSNSDFSHPKSFIVIILQNNHIE